MKSEKSLITRFKPLFIALLVVALIVAVAAPTIAYYIRSGGKVEKEYTPAFSNLPTLKYSVDSTNPEIANVRVQVEDEGYPVYVRVAIVVTWQMLTDCTCIIPKKCICENCEGCDEDGKECSCEVCEEDCPICAKCICGEECGCDEDSKECSCEKCEDCPVCAEPEPCEQCTKGDAEEECTECEGCDECPLCDDNPDNDYDVFYALPVKGDDYTMELDTTTNWVENSDGYYYCKNSVKSGGESPVLIKSCILTADEDSKPSIEDKDIFLSVEIIVQTVQAIGFTDDDNDGDGYVEPAWKDAWKNAPPLIP